jgi:hypothetical protein
MKSNALCKNRMVDTGAATRLNHMANSSEIVARLGMHSTSQSNVLMKTITIMTDTQCSEGKMQLKMDLYNLTKG